EIYPDFYADEGYHEFTYSIYVHPSCDVKEFYKRAESLNRKMTIFNGKITAPFINVQVLNDNFRILSFRKTEGKLYLRILESVGSSGTSAIKLSAQSAKEMGKVSLVDVLENKLQELEIKDNCVTFDFKPFKFYTFELNT
ncbi:MAG TPA: alpha-mannosidase, partial [Fervidobacterium sp.]|nr:alpha-mannosidase [Fervidobacterium sp.]